MRLLIRSTLRHMKMHSLQTFLTFFVTMMFVAMLSTVFYFTSSFQSLLREYALAEVGEYHYRYIASAGTESGKMLCQMAEAFEKDSWFSKVELKQEDDIELLLTVASPNMFTSKTMMRKFNAIEEDFFANKDDTLQLGMRHNYDLLVSYGDLNKENGMYSYLLIFLFLLTVISAAAILTLVAVYRISASQREHDFALLYSIGADPVQIRLVSVLESVFYILAIPAGSAIGVFFFQILKSKMDDLLFSLQKFPKIQFVVSVPYLIALIVCAAGIILISGLIPAITTANVSPIEVIQGTHDISIPQREKSKKPGSSLPGLAGVEGWLAVKSYQRFRRRRYPILLVLFVTFILCFILAGFRQFAAEVVNLTYKIQSYNLCIDLYCDQLEGLDSFAKRLADCAEGNLIPVREARFELHSPYPFSESGSASFQADGSGFMPDVMLVCLDPDTYADIRSSIGLSEEESGQIQGILIDEENIFGLNPGDFVSIYNTIDPEDQTPGIDIEIAGVQREAPLYIENENAFRMIVLVSEESFLKLETWRPYAEQDPGMYHVSLRGKLEDVNEFERVAAEYINDQKLVTGSIKNYEEEIRQKEASIFGFQYLCTAFILILVFVCICGNFTVSWTISRARQKEFAILSSIGMKPGQVQKMKYLELLFHIVASFIPGVILGLLSYWMLFLIYSAEYQVKWSFPWRGLWLGLLILCISVFFTDIAEKMSLSNGNFLHLTIEN